MEVDSSRTPRSMSECVDVSRYKLILMPVTNQIFVFSGTPSSTNTYTQRCINVLKQRISSLFIFLLRIIRAKLPFLKIWKSQPRSNLRSTKILYSHTLHKHKTHFITRYHYLCVYNSRIKFVSSFSGSLSSNSLALISRGEMLMVINQTNSWCCLDIFPCQLRFFLRKSHPGDTHRQSSQLFTLFLYRATFAFDVLLLRR